MKRTLSAIALVVLSAAAPCVAGDAFDRLKALDGKWKGMAAGAEAEVTYRVTSAGSAVVETLFPGTPHEMVTVYHRDGEDIVLTHFCAAQNQPRMRAKKPGDATTLVFAFDGGTNLDPAKSGHMHDAKIVIEGPDKLRTEWSYWNEGKAGDATVFEVTRVK